MTKRVKEIVQKMRDEGLVDTIHNILVDMKKKKKITVDSEIPECFGEVAQKAGIESPRDMGTDRLRAFINVVESELEDIFGLKVFAGYFVTESFKPITKKKFNALLESVVEGIYDRRYSDEEDDDNNTNDYYILPEKIQKDEPQEPYVLINERTNVTALSDDRTMKFTGYQRARRFCDSGRGGNISYCGSYWVYKIIRLSDKRIEQTGEVNRKQEALEKLYSLPNFNKAKEELSK